MEKTLKDIVQYVRKNYFSYWVILGIDTAISVLCSLVAYAVIHIYGACSNDRLDAL